MTQTIEIPRERWSSYFDALNRQTAGHPVRIEVDDLEKGSQEMARALPLQEIGFEKSGSAHDRIEIRVGFDSGELTHSIGHPTRLYVEQRDDGELECIEIETADGGKTLIFSEHLPALPANASASHVGAP